MLRGGGQTELDVSVFSDGLAHHFEREYPSEIVHNIVEHLICTPPFPFPHLLLPLGSLSLVRGAFSI